MSANLWPLKTIGPTLPSSYLDKRLERDSDYAINLFEPAAGACSAWLDSQPPGSVVYVSFGSLARLPEIQLSELSSALVRTGHPFLWVVRSVERHKLPQHLTATGGESSSRFLIVPWCNQLEVLSHGSVGCFVTHCGLNSVVEAICLGVPMVAVPQWTDQGTNAKYIEDVWRVGVRARVSEGGDDGGEIVRADALEECVREVMEGDRGKEMRANALKWKEKARAAVDEGGSSDRNINAFAQQLQGMIINK